MASLPLERRRGIEARASQLIAQERLRNLRTALGLSQKDLAELLNVTQPAISKMERQEDMQISTLASIIAAMGGTLEITARFPGREAVRLACPQLPYQRKLRHVTHFPSKLFTPRV